MLKQESFQGYKFEMKVFTLYELALQTSIMRYKIKANIVSGDYLADV